MKIKILVCTTALLLGLYTITINTGFGGPSHAHIKKAAAQNKGSNDSIELSAFTIVKRWPKFVFSGDQRFYYTQNAVLKEDHLRSVGSVVWRKKCEENDEELALKLDWENMRVYETVATKGTPLTLHGDMKAYRKNGQWEFTATSSRLEKNQEHFSAIPASRMETPAAVLIDSTQFKQLCQSVFVE